MHHYLELRRSLSSQALLKKENLTFSRKSNFDFSALILFRQAVIITIHPFNSFMFKLPEITVGLIAFGYEVVNFTQPITVDLYFFSRFEYLCLQDLSCRKKRSLHSTLFIFR